MPPQQFAIAAPTTEEMTRTGVGVVGAGIAGVLEGVAVKMGPQLGALETPFTWAMLLGVPAIGIAGALALKGLASDLFQGVATGGTAIAAYVVPAMVIPEGLFGKKRTTLDAAGVKRLGAGNPLNAPKRAQEAAAGAGLEF